VVRVVKDCYGDSLQLVLCCKHSCFLTLWLNKEYLKRSRVSQGDDKGGVPLKHAGLPDCRAFA